jgi:hypothetical protein
MISTQADDFGPTLTYCSRCEGDSWQWHSRLKASEAPGQYWRFPLTTLTGLDTKDGFEKLENSTVLISVQSIVNILMK